jgi:hypothetical protein
MRIVLVFCSTLWLLACDEEPYRSYADIPEAKAAGELARGWLLEWVPHSATDVHLQNNVDTNEWWLRVDLSPAAADSLRMHLTEVAAADVRARRPRRSRSWWFEALVQHHAANDAALNALLFRGTGDPVQETVVVAFDRTSNTVYLWTDGVR